MVVSMAWEPAQEGLAFEGTHAKKQYCRNDTLIPVREVFSQISSPHWPNAATCQLFSRRQEQPQNELVIRIQPNEAIYYKATQSESARTSFKGCSSMVTALSGHSHGVKQFHHV